MLCRVMASTRSVAALPVRLDAFSVLVDARMEVRQDSVGQPQEDAACQEARARRAARLAAGRFGDSMAGARSDQKTGGDHHARRPSPAW